MDIAIANGDVTRVSADLLVLKHANAFHGADRAVAEIIGFNERVPKGTARFYPGTNLEVPEVVFIGVGPLSEFRYEGIQEFSAQVVKLARQHRPAVRHLTMTVHGPGYGLDPEQAFLSMIAGLIAEPGKAQEALRKITIVERSEKRCELLRAILTQHMDEFGLTKSGVQAAASVAAPDLQSVPAQTNILHFGARAEEKPRLFIAMPFSDGYVDEFEIAFCEAARASGYVCERLDLESFIGDIVSEIKRRILTSHGVIALLNDHNPNVFLEVGFALAHNKPTILVAKADVTLPFDVRGHRCVRYHSISQLRRTLSAEIAALKAQGVLVQSA